MPPSLSFNLAVFSKTLSLQIRQEYQDRMSLLTVKDLREAAKQHNIKGRSKMKKDDLIQALLDTYAEASGS